MRSEDGRVTRVRARAASSPGQLTLSRSVRTAYIPLRRATTVAASPARVPMTFPFRPRSAWWVTVVAVAASATGCTSALTSAYLRGMPWERSEHAAETVESASIDDRPTAAAVDQADDVPPGADDERRAAAIDEAVSRLTRIGALDESATTALVATLQSTQQEDWPVVIAEFAAALGAPTSSRAPNDAPEHLPVVDATPVAVAHPDGREADPPPATAAALPHVVAKADLTPREAGAGTIPSEKPPAGPDAAASSTVTVATDGARHPDAGHGRAAEPAGFSTGSDTATVAGSRVDDADPRRGLEITNACFVSRVQAWGVIDRFPEDRFRAGREVIVYFELDNLAVQATPAGHTTCIDTVLTLVDAAGHAVHEWNFEPIAESCSGRRRDYFARYVVRIPEEAPPGDCRIRLRVIDTLASKTAEADLPLRILATGGPDAG